MKSIEQSDTLDDFIDSILDEGGPADEPEHKRGRVAYDYDTYEGLQNDIGLGIKDLDDAHDELESALDDLDSGLLFTNEELSIIMNCKLLTRVVRSFAPDSEERNRAIEVLARIKPLIGWDSDLWDNDLREDDERIWYPDDDLPKPCYMDLDDDNSIRRVGSDDLVKMALDLERCLQALDKKLPRAIRDTIKALRETQTTGQIIPMHIFKRLVREGGQEFAWEPEAMEMLRAAAEDHLIETFSNAGLVTAHGYRTVVTSKDISFGTQHM